MTLLQSATQSYEMGVSGGYWYAVGGTLQIAIFSVIASKVKRNANGATTFPEVCLMLCILDTDDLNSYTVPLVPRLHMFALALQAIYHSFGVVWCVTPLCPPASFWVAEPL